MGSLSYRERLAIVVSGTSLLVAGLEVNGDAALLKEFLNAMRF
ncbi:hypothetical protein ACSHWB_15065 [Lentzea sp. HUAS TT2]